MCEDPVLRESAGRCQSIVSERIGCESITRMASGVVAARGIRFLSGLAAVGISVGGCATPATPIASPSRVPIRRSGHQLTTGVAARRSLGVRVVEQVGDQHQDRGGDRDS